MVIAALCLGLHEGLNPAGVLPANALDSSMQEHSPGSLLEHEQADRAPEDQYALLVTTTCMQCRACRQPVATSLSLACAPARLGPGEALALHGIPPAPPQHPPRHAGVA